MKSIILSAFLLCSFFVIAQDDVVIPTVTKKDTVLDNEDMYIRESLYQDSKLVGRTISTIQNNITYRAIYQPIKKSYKTNEIRDIDSSMDVLTLKMDYRVTYKSKDSIVDVSSEPEHMDVSALNNKTKIWVNYPRQAPYVLGRMEIFSKDMDEYT